MKMLTKKIWINIKKMLRNIRKNMVKWSRSFSLLHFRNQRNLRKSQKRRIQNKDKMIKMNSHKMNKTRMMKMNKSPKIKSKKRRKVKVQYLKINK